MCDLTDVMLQDLSENFKIASRRVVFPSYILMVNFRFTYKTYSQVSANNFKVSTKQLTTNVRSLI